jgi:hypothetical protein
MCHKLAVPQRRTPTIGHGILFWVFLLRPSNSSLPLASSPLQMDTLDERVMPVLMAEKVMGLASA